MINLDYISDANSSLLIETFMTTTGHRRPTLGKAVDPWSYFGVPVGASNVTIRKSYLQVVKAVHPDKLVTLPIETQAPLSKEFKRASENYRLLTDRVSGEILRTYGLEGWRVYKVGDSAAKVREKLMRDYAKKYHIRDVFGPTSDPLRASVFKDPLREGRDGTFKFDPNSTTNEGRWRLRDPKSVSHYYRKDSSTPGISYVMGKDNKTGESVVQAVRFNKTMFTEMNAARWWAKNKRKAKLQRLWTWESKQ